MKIRYGAYGTSIETYIEAAIRGYKNTGNNPIYMMISNNSRAFKWQCLLVLSAITPSGDTPIKVLPLVGVTPYEFYLADKEEDLFEYLL